MNRAGAVPHPANRPEKVSASGIVTPPANRFSDQSQCCSRSGGRPGSGVRLLITPPLASRTISATALHILRRNGILCLVDNVDLNLFGKYCPVIEVSISCLFFCSCYSLPKPSSSLVTGEQHIGQTTMRIVVDAVSENP